MTERIHLNELLHLGYSRRRWLILGAIVVAGIVAAAVIATIGRRSAGTTIENDAPHRVGEAIEVSPTFRATAGIETSPASRSPLAPLIKLVGAAAFDPTRVAAVGTRAPGVVTKVLHVEGDSVERGALLAEVSSPTLTTAQADLRIAEAKKLAARANRDREKGLLERHLTTAREYETAVASLAEERALSDAARQRVEALGGANVPGTSELRAPVAGIVAERAIAPGQNVGPSLVAFRVGDLDRLWVLLQVFERHLSLIREGDPVDIRALSDGKHVIQGTIALVGSVLDPTTRTADVRVELDNRGLELRPGQAVEATIRASGPARTALSVPQSALTYVDGAPTVFVAETPTRFVPRQVELGIDGGDRVEIVRGVAEGEQVVSRSVLALKSELFR